MIDQGFSAVAIADRVGHESIDITYNYAHLFPSKQAEMARVSPEEDAQIERYVQLSGLTKQDYITRRLTHKDGGRAIPEFSRRYETSLRKCF